MIHLIFRKIIITLKNKASHFLTQIADNVICGRPPQTGSKVGISHFALEVKTSVFLGSCVWNEWTSVSYNFTSRCPIELVEVSF